MNNTITNQKQKNCKHYTAVEKTRTGDFTTTDVFGGFIFSTGGTACLSCGKRLKKMIVKSV